MAEGPAPRRIGPRSQRVTHGDAGARTDKNATMKSSTFCIFTSTTIRAVLAPADTLSDHAARQARSAGTSAGVHDIFIDPGDFDIERSAASGAAIQLGPHHPSWPAGKVADAAAGDPWLSGRCVYRNSNSERIDDEVRPVWRANL